MGKYLVSTSYPPHICCFPDMPHAPFAIGCILSFLMLLLVVSIRRFQSLPLEKQPDDPR